MPDSPDVRCEAHHQVRLGKRVKASEYYLFYSCMRLFHEGYSPILYKFEHPYAVYPAPAVECMDKPPS